MHKTHVFFTAKLCGKPRGRDPHAKQQVLWLLGKGAVLWHFRKQQNQERNCYQTNWPVRPDGSHTRTVEVIGKCELLPIKRGRGRSWFPRKMWLESDLPMESGPTSPFIGYFSQGKYISLGFTFSFENWRSGRTKPRRQPGMDETVRCGRTDTRRNK